MFLITHDLDTLYAICDRVAVLADKKVVAVGTIDELLALDHPWIQEYFNGPRGRAAAAGLQKGHREPDGNAFEPCAGRHRGPGCCSPGCCCSPSGSPACRTRPTKCFDIYFSQGVGGLNKGSAVTFSGVPVGEIEQISLLPDRPEFVWVRIEVDAETPVLQGTTAADQGRRLHRGQRNPARRRGQGRPPDRPGRAAGLPGHPVDARAGSAPCSTRAPELIDRIQRLTERLTELLSDKNQNSISDILENVDKTTACSPSARPTSPTRCGDARIAARNAGIAAQRVGVLADSTNRLVNEQGKPAAEDLRKAIAAVADARPTTSTR